MKRATATAAAAVAFALGLPAEARGCLKGWIQITPTSNFCVPIKEEDKAVYDNCWRRKNSNINAVYACMQHYAPHMFNY